MARKKNDGCPTCSYTGTFPLGGEGFSRRRFFRIAGTALVGSYFLDVMSPSLLQAAPVVNPPLKNSAKNCILIFLQGAPSQIDTWDLKEGAWTPMDFAPTTYNGNLRFPQGLLPKTAEHLGKLSIVRSGLAWAAVHSLAQTWTQISRSPTGALGKVSPHIGSVVALEMQQRRQLTDVLPGFVSLNSLNTVGAGYLPSTYAPFKVIPSAEGLTTLRHPDGQARLDSRYARLQAIDTDRVTGALAKNSTDMAAFYDQAKVMIDSPDVEAIFRFTQEERSRYGATNFGDGLITARNLVRAGKGTRFVQVTHGGWDHHANIYATQGQSLRSQCAAFDPAFGALMTDLSSTPGSVSGKTLLDETLVVVLGEFGRTVGPLNGQLGRDHFLRMSLLFAGGGVTGGKIIGVTNDSGANAIDFGWSAKRDVRPEDVTCTIYSALGIDYTTVRMDDPIGRGFEYVPFAKDGEYQPVDELF